MTPREFEAALRSTGLPGEPVAKLTHLFEDVRYGAARSGPREEEQAVACLSAIVAARPAVRLTLSDVRFMRVSASLASGKEPMRTSVALSDKEQNSS